MKYPSVTESQLREFVHQWKRGVEFPIDPVWVGQGEEINLETIERAAAQVYSLMDEPEGRDQVEGKAAVFLYQALRPESGTGCHSVDVPVLDDPGFWRYLGAKWLWEFVVWRYPSIRESYRDSVHFRYVDAVSSTECVPTRMFLRMTAVGGVGRKALASCLTDAADFWQSHILRVRTVDLPCLVRAMVKSQQKQRLTTSRIRELAKRVNRTRSNIVMELYSEKESEQLLGELRNDLED